MEYSDQKIREIYEDPENPSSFSGLLTFQKSLELDYKVKVPISRLKNILSASSTYLQNVTRSRNIPRRSYNIHGFGSLFQTDLTELKVVDNYRYILVIIDCYTLFLQTYPLKNKQADTIVEAFKSAFSEYGAPNNIESDAGGVSG